MVEVEQRSLRSLEQDALAVAQRPVDESEVSATNGRNRCAKPS